MNETYHVFNMVPWNDLHYIYVISNAELGLYKIGYSKEPGQRLKQIRQDSAFDLKFVMVWECGSEIAARAFEDLFHDRYAYCRSHGEWFKLEPEDLRIMRMHHITKIPANMVYPFKHHEDIQHPYHSELLM